MAGTSCITFSRGSPAARCPRCGWPVAAARWCAGAADDDVWPFQRCRPPAGPALTLLPVSPSDPDAATPLSSACAPWRPASWPWPRSLPLVHAADPSRSRTSGSRACSAPTPAPCSRAAVPHRRHLHRRQGAAALRALFATGLFKDVRIEIDGKVAVVIVEERSIIASVSFVGLKEFDKDTLLKSLKDSGIGEGLPFRPRPGRPGRAGDQAPVPQPQPLRRRGGDHDHPARAQPRQRHLHDDRRRRGQDQGHPHRRHQGFPKRRCSACMDLHAQAAGSPGTASPTATRAPSSMPTWKRFGLITSTGATSSSRSSRPRSRSRPTSRTIASISVKEGQPYTVTAVRLEGSTWARRRSFRRWC
jgi:hypothetical protein